MYLQRDIDVLAQLLTQQQEASVEANQLIRKYLDQVYDKVIGVSQCLPHYQTASGSYLVDGGEAGTYRISRQMGTIVLRGVSSGLRGLI
jgi:hypothetical protein